VLFSTHFYSFLISVAAKKPSSAACVCGFVRGGPKASQTDWVTAASQVTWLTGDLKVVIYVYSVNIVAFGRDVSDFASQPASNACSIHADVVTSMMPEDAIQTMVQRQRTGSYITIRAFTIFPDLYLSLPWSQFWPASKVRSEVVLGLMGLECSGS